MTSFHLCVNHYQLSSNPLSPTYSIISTSYSCKWSQWGYSQTFRCWYQYQQVHNLNATKKYLHFRRLIIKEYLSICEQCKDSKLFSCLSLKPYFLTIIQYLKSSSLKWKKTNEFTKIVVLNLKSIKPNEWNQNLHFI